MKILFLSTVFPNAIEPSRGCFNDSLVRALAIKHQVEVVSPIPWVDLVRGYRRGLRVPMYQRIADPAGFGIHYVPFLYPPKILRSKYCTFYWSSIAGTVQSLIRTHRPELIISYWAHPDGEAAVRIGRLVGAPSCVIIGGSDVLLMTRKPSRRRRVQAVLQATDAVITVNDDLKEAVVRLGIRADKVHVWRQGIDVGRFQPGDRHLARQQLGIPVSGRVIVWVGRMVPVKGLDILLGILLTAADTRRRLSPLPRWRWPVSEGVCGPGRSPRTLHTHHVRGPQAPPRAARLVSRRRFDRAAEPIRRTAERAARVAGLRDSVRGQRCRGDLRDRR